jgi:hypothetical protein
MLDYAIIGRKKKEVRKLGKHDELIAFLESCLFLPEITALVLTQSRHMQTSSSLPQT